MDRRREWEDRTNEVTLDTGKVKAKTVVRYVKRKTNTKRKVTAETRPEKPPLWLFHCWQLTIASQRYYFLQSKTLLIRASKTDFHFLDFLQIF